MESVSEECNGFAREGDFGLLVFVEPVRIAYPYIQTILFFKTLDLTHEMPSMAEKAIEGCTIDEMHIMMNHLVNQQLPEHLFIQFNTS